MEITDKNITAAAEILQILAKGNCTVSEAAEILSYVNKKIYTTSTVQLPESII